LDHLRKEASKVPAKKKLGGSKASHMKEKEEQPVNKAAVEHFLKMALVPQIGNPRGPSLDFERTASKWFVQQVGNVKYHANVEYRARANFEKRTT
jgi:hypothetical protein